MKKSSKFIVSVCLMVALLVPTISLSAHDFDYDHNMGGYGSHSGVDLGNASWSLSIAPSYAESQGYLFNGASGYVYCGVQVDYTYYDSDVYNSNNLLVYGDGEYAEIWFHNVI